MIVLAVRNDVANRDEHYGQLYDRVGDSRGSNIGAGSCPVAASKPIKHYIFGQIRYPWMYVNDLSASGPMLVPKGISLARCPT
jgi:hypothetical protein